MQIQNSKVQKVHVDSGMDCTFPTLLCEWSHNVRVYEVINEMTVLSRMMNMGGFSETYVQRIRKHE
jgi:hypothetical protein